MSSEMDLMGMVGGEKFLDDEVSIQRNMKKMAATKINLYKREWYGLVQKPGATKKGKTRRIKHEQFRRVFIAPDRIEHPSRK